MRQLEGSVRGAAGAEDGCVRAAPPVDLGERTTGRHLPRSALALRPQGRGRRVGAAVVNVVVGLMWIGPEFDVILNSNLRLIFEMRRPQVEPAR